MRIRALERTETVRWPCVWNKDFHQKLSDSPHHLRVCQVFKFHSKFKTNCFFFLSKFLDIKYKDEFCGIKMSRSWYCSEDCLACFLGILLLSSFQTLVSQMLSCARHKCRNNGLGLLGASHWWGHRCNSGHHGWPSWYPCRRYHQRKVHRIQILRSWRGWL